MPTEIKPAASGAGEGAAGAGSSNDELSSILYPQGGGAAAAVADADHDLEFDDPDDGAEADPEADPAVDPQPGAKAAAETGDEPAADPDADPDADPAADPEPQPDGEPDDDKGLLAKAKFSPDQQKVVDKLLGKKTAANRELREKATKLESRATLLEQENDQLKQGLPAPAATRDNPLADASTEAELVARERNALSLRNWLVRNRDGGELPDAKGGKTTISPERRDELLAETDELFMVHLPARRQFIQQRRSFDGEARRAFPDLADSKSELSLRVDAALRHYPALQSMPEARLFIADALANREARTKGASAAARAAAPGAGVARPGQGKDQSRKPPRTEGAPRVAARVSSRGKVAEQAVERFEKTGRDDDNVVLAELIGGRSR